MADSMVYRKAAPIFGLPAVHMASATSTLQRFNSTRLAFSVSA